MFSERKSNGSVKVLPFKLDGRMEEEEEGRGTARPRYPKAESRGVWSLFWEMEDSGPKGCVVTGALFRSRGDGQSSGD